MKYINTFPLFFMLLLAGRFTVEAELLSFDIKLTNGYRHDSLSAKTKIEESYYGPSLNDNLKISSVSLYEIGLQGKITLLNFFGRLEGAYGWAGSGRYHEHIPFFSDSISSVNSKVENGNTKNWTFGAGYHFNVIPLCDWVKIGPMIGWSHDEQKFNMKPRKSEFVNLAYHNFWEGPFAGIDLALQLCEFALHTSYEYHWVNWEAKRHLENEGSFSGRLSNRLKSNHAFGQVLNIDGRWNFNLCWFAGISIKVQEWEAIKGHLKTLKDQFGLNPSHHPHKMKDAHWKSFAITFDLGFNL
ncbi:MAG: hypothetical protein H0V82_10410 [Candidatus Protochlamydia sp.]|nr:hypothetical protein [Candidatus Protochlamydia sp.]